MRIAARPRGPVQAVEQPQADVVLFQHRGYGFFLVESCPSPAAAFGVGGERDFEVLRQAEIVHHQAAGLVFEDAVDAGYRLHQAVSAHGLVNVHGVQAWGVESGQPHIADNGNLERVVGVGNRSSPRLVSDVRLPVRRVSRRGHDYLDGALAVVFVMPFGTDRRW